MGSFKRISLYSVIVMTLLIIALSVLNIQGSFDPPYLLPILNTLFIGILLSIVAYFAAKVYLKIDKMNYLFMFCAMSIMGLGAILSGWSRYLPDGVNLSFAIYNSSFFIGAAFHLLAALWEGRIKKPSFIKSAKTKLTLALLGVFLFTALLLLSCLLKIMPLFYEQNSFTELRQNILGAAIVFLFSSSMLYVKNYQRQKSDFLYWYSISLILIVIGLAGAIIVKVVGGYANWLVRLTQYLGSFYALLSILSVLKESKIRGLSNSRIMADFFADGESSYKKLAESSNDAILTVNQKFQVLYINSTAMKKFGLRYNEFIGMPFFDLLSTDSLKALVRADYEAFMRMGESSLAGKTIEMEAKRKDYGTFPIELSASYRKLSADCFCTYLIRDITDRKNAEAQVSKLIDDLREADRNKDDFISVLSHELRNPLATIEAALSFFELSDDKNKTEKMKEIMRHEIDQLCHLVNDLLDVTRMSRNKIELKKQIIKINEVAISAIKSHQALFEDKGVTLKTEFADDSFYLYADPVRITQIIGNLLNNALKFSEKGGTTKLSVFKENSKLMIRSKDDGIGIAPEFLPDIFKPFVQADNSLDRCNGGLGLGLSIVKGVAELHGGSVSAYSEGLGKGTEFIVTLPVTIDD